MGWWSTTHHLDQQLTQAIVEKDAWADAELEGHCSDTQGMQKYV